MRRRGWWLVLLFSAFLGGWLTHALLVPGGEPGPTARGAGRARAAADVGEVDRLREDNAALRARLAERRPSPGPTDASGSLSPEPSRRAVALTAIHIALRAEDAVTGMLRLRVRTPAGEAVPGISVRSLRGSDPASRDAVTDADGVAEFPDLAPGEWHLEIPLPEGRHASNVPVQAGHVTEVALVLPTEGVPFEGLVRDPTGGFVEGLTVTLSTLEGGFYTTLRTKTDAHGWYHFDGVRPGGWTVALSSRANRGSSQASRVFVPAGGTFRKDFLAGPLLRGTVREQGTGAPIAGAQVECQRRGLYVDRVTTGADGAFDFGGLSPGTLDLFVSRAGYGFTIVRNVVVPEEGVAVDVEMSPAARLRLHFTDAQGRPASGNAYLGIMAKVEGEGTSLGTNLHVNADGRATYDQILPGAYGLHFKLEGIGEARMDVTLTPGENSLEVRLEAK